MKKHISAEFVTRLHHRRSLKKISFNISLIAAGFASAAFVLLNSGFASPLTQTAVLAANKPTTKLSVLYAGSMTKVMESKIGPDIKSRLSLQFQGEGQGSSALAQLIKSGLAQPDVFISASPSVNSKLLMGKANHNLVTWYANLAVDQLVIAYNPKSRFAAKLNAAKAHKAAWYKVMETPGFRFGRTDPLLDPKGASTIIMMELAQRYYHQAGLKQHILGADENSQQVFPEESLLAELTSGQLDAVIAYRHEAVEWKVPFITLPPAINLGDVKYAKRYSTATFTGKDGKVQKGAPIMFTITIPTTVKNEKGAEAFTRYMLTGRGHHILMQDGFLPTSPIVSGDVHSMPASLRHVVKIATK